MSADRLIVAAFAAASGAQSDPEVVRVMRAASAGVAPGDGALLAFHVARLIDERRGASTWTRALGDRRTRAALMRSSGYLVEHGASLAGRVRVRMDVDDGLNRSVLAWLIDPGAGAGLVAAVSGVVVRGAVEPLAGAWWSVFGDRVVGLFAFERLGRGRPSPGTVAELDRRRAVGLALLGTRLWTATPVADALAVSRVTVESWKRPAS